MGIETVDMATGTEVVTVDGEEEEVVMVMDRDTGTDTVEAVVEVDGVEEGVAEGMQIAEEVVVEVGLV